MILNVSSHFGGVRHGTVAYPNRADYAVSKAGQRALVEALAPLLGPDVQINAIAPGPVDGVRLRGSASRPGLYARRAKLILETKRMNLIYSALVTVRRCGQSVAEALDVVAQNHVGALKSSHLEPLQILGQALDIERQAHAGGYLLTRALAERLVDRLRRAAFLPAEFSGASFFKAFDSVQEPFSRKNESRPMPPRFETRC